MKLLKRNGRYELVSTYEERAFPKDARFRWDPLKKMWWTDRQENAARLAAYAEPEVQTELGAIAEQQKLAQQESRSVDADIEIPIADGIQYKGYQKGAIAYALKRRSVLFGDAPGLGKTWEAIGVINATPSIERVLVVCPANLKVNWQRELKRVLARPFDIQIVNGKPIDMAVPGRGQVIVLNYDILNKHAAALQAMKFDFLILDESHYIKNHERKEMIQRADGKWVAVDKKKGEKGSWRFKTQRVQAVFDLAPACAKISALTGTAILNRTKELWTTLHLLDPQRWPNFFAFGKRYCGGYQDRFGWNFDGATNLDELQRLLRETVMVRRLKEDVLKELPAKQRQIIELPRDGYEAALAAEDEVEERFAEQVEAIETARDFAQANEDMPSYEAAVARLRQVRAAEFAEMSRVRHDTAVAKIPAVVEHTVNLLDQVDKVIVFGHHHDVFDGLEAAFSAAGFKPVRITGAESNTVRQASIDSFQTRPDVRVAIVSITIATGITLTAASMEVFAELDWVPGNMTQAEDRAHRIGQLNSVLIHHLVLENSLDCRMAKQLVAKQDVADRALDRLPEPLQVEETRKRKASPKLAELPNVTPEQVPAIHAALQFLSARCDFANSLDGAGFNKMDAQFGHSLANAGQLTINQATFGLKMVRKYRRQLGADMLHALGIA